jgi:hypothetical protein
MASLVIRDIAMVKVLLPAGRRKLSGAYAR